MIIEYARVREDIIPPTRAHASDAGLDLYWNCSDDKKSVIIEPGESILLESGLRFGVPHNFMLKIENRSSIASKKKLLVGANVVDSAFDGEVFINLINVGNEPQTIYRGDKIAQAILIPVISFKAMENHSKDLYGYYPIAISDRGSGSFGSTDKK